MKAVNKIKNWWNRLIAPYEDEKYEDFMDSVDCVCYECIYRNNNVCDECPVTKTKEHKIKNRS